MHFAFIESKEEKLMEANKARTMRKKKKKEEESFEPGGNATLACELDSLYVEVNPRAWGCQICTHK